MNLNELKDKGFLIFDFPKPENLKVLHAQLSELVKQKQNPYSQQGFYITSFDSDPSFREKVNELVTATIKEFIEKHFPEYKILLSNVILKEPGDKEVPLHQDWSFIDETRHSSYELWTPLNNITKENGGMYLLENSHQWFKNYRSTKVNTKCVELYPQLKHHLTYIDLKFGQGIIFDHRLMHYTPPNRTDKNRLVMQTAIIPKECDPLFAFRDNDSDPIDIYQVDPPFFMHRNIFTRPTDYPIYKTVPSSENELIDLEIIKAKLRKNRPLRYFYKEITK